jgi:hypothetical protein
VDLEWRWWQQLLAPGSKVIALQLIQLCDVGTRRSHAEGEGLPPLGEGGETDPNRKCRGLDILQAGRVE